MTEDKDQVAAKTEDDGEPKLNRRGMYLLQHHCVALPSIHIGGKCGILAVWN